MRQTLFPHAALAVLLTYVVAGVACASTESDASSVAGAQVAGGGSGEGGGSVAPGGHGGAAGALVQTGGTGGVAGSPGKAGSAGASGKAGASGSSGKGGGSGAAGKVGAGGAGGSAVGGGGTGGTSAAGVGGGGGAAPAPLTVKKHPTGLHGIYQRVAVDGSGAVHLVYVPDGEAGLKYAKLVSGAWSSPTTIPGSGDASQWFFNLPSLALDPSSQPHVIWGLPPNDPAPKITYWNGATNQTTDIYDQYVEYEALGISSSGAMVVGAGVVALPGQTATKAWAGASLSGGTLGSFTELPAVEVEVKFLSFCGGQDGTLHMVGRLGKVDYVTWDGSTWGTPEQLGPGGGAAQLGVSACVVDDAGATHVAWTQWVNDNGNWKPVEIRHATRTASSWLPSQDGATLRTLPGKSSGPTIARRPDGALLVVWSEATTLFASLSTDGGSTFADPVAVVDDVESCDDDDYKHTTAFAAGGRLQVIYRSTSGELVRAVLE